MTDFKQVCESFCRAVPLDPVPPFTIDPRGLRVDDDIYEKLRNLWENKYPGQDPPKLEDSGLGVYEIGDFTGNELLRKLIICFNDRDYNQEKNYMYFNIGGKTRFVLLFVKTSVLTAHLSDGHPQMFVKLFKDNEVLQHRRDDENEKENAKKEFPKFLKTQIAKFKSDKVGIEIALGNVFISLLAKCAYRMSQLDGLRERNPAHGYPVDNSLMDKFENIPYPACIKFAFDAGLTGKISELFGEGDYTVKMKCQGAVKVAEELIKSAFEIDRLVKGAFTAVGEGLYDEEATKRIAEEIRKFYATPPSVDKTK